LFLGARLLSRFWEVSRKKILILEKKRRSYEAMPMILFTFLLLTLTTNAIEIRFYGDDETCSKENLADTKFQDVSGTGCSG